MHSHAPSIRSHRGIKVVWPDFQPMRVPEEPVCVRLFRRKPVFTSLHLKSPVHVHRLRMHPVYPKNKTEIWLTLFSLCCLSPTGGLHRDVVYLGWPIAPSYMIPNAGGGGELRPAGSKPLITAVHRSPNNWNKLWRSNFIFNSVFNLCSTKKGNNRCWLVLSMTKTAELSAVT